MRLDPISSLATLSLVIVAVYINSGYVNENINNNTLGYNEGGNRFAQASRRSDKLRLALFDLSMGPVQMGQLSRYSVRDVVRQHVQKRRFRFHTIDFDRQNDR